MNHYVQEDTVAIRRCRSRRAADQYALVLSAMGIRSEIEPDQECFALSVALFDRDRANTELMAYDYERLQRPTLVAKPLLPFLRIEAALIYWATILLFFALARNHAFSINWVEDGAVQAGKMLAGEWWRSVTALCLHVDIAHLLGNLVFGTFFFLLLSQLTGTGVAGLMMVIAGASGNVINALVHSSAHTSIGASTAIFAGLGVLVALRHSEKQSRGASSFRAWTPIAAGFGMLAFLGFSGENTDFLAHVFGFASGIVAGYGLGRWGKNRSDDSVFQWRCFAITVAIIMVSWAIAITS